MKELMRLNKKQIRTHLIAWSAIIIYLNITDPVPGSWVAKIFGSALIFGNYIFIFYSLSLFVFPKFWKINQIFLASGLFACLIIYWINIYFIYVKIIPFLGGQTYYQNASLFYIATNTLFYFFILSSAGIASFFSRYSLFSIKMQAEKEKSLLLKELNFLKNQFNSHITFNFLNYCYSKIHLYSPDAAESIELFSDMLRYTLQTKPDESVTLENEILYIENFINLQKLLSAKIFCDFTCEGEIQKHRILPRILITFVENAFKHGIFNDHKFPIKIYLKVNARNLFFSVENKINYNKKTISSNIGSENVKQILNLYYHKNYELYSNENNNYYLIKLSINL